MKQRLERNWKDILSRNPVLQLSLVNSHTYPSLSMYTPYSSQPHRQSTDKKQLSSRMTPWPTRTLDLICQTFLAVLSSGYPEWKLTVVRLLMRRDYQPGKYRQHPSKSRRTRADKDIGLRRKDLLVNPKPSRFLNCVYSK